MPWPTWQVAVGASSCNPTQWCAALNIDSLALNPVTGKTLNPTCLAKVGEEYVNFGHFQFCTGPVKIPATPFGLLANGNPTTCPTGDMEGRGASASAPDADDLFCFPGSEALVYRVNGCTYTNTGFDGASYQKLWPDGNLQDHPAPFQFTSPTTGPGYTQQYQRAALETDLPAIESTCNPATGAGCTLIPQTDQKRPAAFYPFYSITNTRHGGSSANLYQDFRNIMAPNPCPAQ